MLIVTEALLYVSFSLLVGGLLIHAIPVDRRPPVRIPKPLLAGSALSVGILSFGPVVAAAAYLAEANDFWIILRSVIFDFQVGKAWLMTLAVSLILFVLIVFNDLSRSRLLSRVAVGWAGLLIVLAGWASHAASQAPTAGFLAHTLHLAAVCTWTGILIAVGWFAKESTHWEAFLRWFTPAAIGCFIVAAAAGLWLMQIIVPEYVNSWLLPYGEALLVKHLLLLPLLWFAFVNGFRIRARLKKNPDFDPLPWVRAESVWVLLIFGTTAFMGQQAPPHQVAETLKFTAPSPLVPLLTGSVPEPPVSLVWTPFSGLAGLVALLFMGTLWLALRRDVSPGMTIGMGIGLVIAGFLACLTAIS